MAARKKKSGRLSRSEFSALLHGNTYSALQRTLSPRQFKRLRQEAKRRGLTLEGLISDRPAHLKERSVRGIRREARGTIDSIYAPFEGELDRQEGTIKSLDEKRKVDNQFFLNWLAQQSEKLRSHAR